jgi:acyl-CoA hydrolase
MNVARHAPLIRMIAMPADANPAGDIFGDWLMAQWTLPPPRWRRAARAIAW